MDSHESLVPQIDACRREVRRLQHSFEWNLLSEEEFVRRACAVVASMALNPRNAAIYVYSPVLHAACAGELGPDAQDDGYRQLQAYLRNIIEHRSYPPQFRHDVLQNTIERVFHTFAHCRHAQTFLMFSIGKLGGEIKAELRKQNRTESLDRASARGGAERSVTIEATWGYEGVHGSDFDPAKEVSRREFQQIVRELIVRSFANYPRATEQLAAFWLKHRDELDEETICNILQVSVGSAQTLRSRAKAKLRNDPVWQAAARSAGYLPLDDDEPGAARYASLR